MSNKAEVARANTGSSLSEKKAQPTLMTRSFTAICLSTFLLYMYPHIMVATFPFYLQSLGADELIIGIAASGFSLCSMLVRPFAGYINDKISRSLLVVIGFCAIIAISLGYAFGGMLMFVVALRTLHGLFHGMTTASMSVNATDAAPPERFGEAMGIFGMSMALPLSIAPAIGLAVMKKAGFRAMFFLLIGMMILALLMMLKGFSFRRIERERPLPRLRLKDVLSPEALPAGVVMFFPMMTYTGVSSFIAIFAESAGKGNTGIFFTLWAIVSVLMRLFFARLIDKRGEKIPIMIGNTCFLLGVVLAVFAPNPAVFYLAGMVYGAGFGFLHPAAQTMSVRHVAPERRGAASSTYLIICDLGSVLGGVLSGWLAKHLDLTVMMLIMAAWSIVSALVYWLWARHAVEKMAQQ